MDQGKGDDDKQRRGQISGRNTPVKENEHTDSQAQKPNSQVGGPPWSRKVEMAALVATVIMAAASIWQGYLTRESNEITRASVEVAGRSWIVVIDASMIDVNDDTPSLITVKNVGQAPAIITRYRSQSSLNAMKLTKLPELLPEDKTATSEYSVAAIGPGMTKTFRSKENPIDPTHRKLLLDEKWHLYMFGFIEYSDPFADNRRTDYCMYWERDAWAECPWGNKLQ